MFIGSSSYLLAESGNLLAESGRGPISLAYLAESVLSPGGDWHISWRRVACFLAESGISPGGERQGSPGGERQGSPGGER